MTTIEVPYSIAAALPDAVGDGHHERGLARGAAARTVATGSPTSRRRTSSWLVRVQERETGLLRDLEELLERVVPREHG